MKLFRFDPQAGKEDEQFGSVKAVISKVLQLDDKAEINAVYIRPNESISHQQTVTQQLLLLVEGQGWVKSGPDEKLVIQAGQALFWERDEGHEIGTETGATAVIIETVNINPAELMPILQENEP
jgi:quercetin dioxygenase-like cupin family protein